MATETGILGAQLTPEWMQAATQTPHPFVPPSATMANGNYIQGVWDVPNSSGSMEDYAGSLDYSKAPQYFQTYGQDQEVGSQASIYNPDGTFNRNYTIEDNEISPLMGALMVAGAGLGFNALAGMTGAGAAGSGAGFVGEGAASGIGGWDAALASASPGTAGAAAAGGAGALGSGAGGAGSILSQIKNVPGLGSLISSALGGGSGGTGSGGTGIDLGNVIGMLSGGLDYANQNKASKEMLDWLKSRQAINDNMYAPGSAEYNALWDEMSRKDAAAGRNSQYGPRSVDLAARIAQLKMDANTRMTTGIGNFMANAMNQKAAAPAGLSAALQNLLGGGTGSSGGGITNTLNSLINKLSGWNGSSPLDLGGGISINPDGSISGGVDFSGDLSNDDIWDMINGVGF